MSDETPGLPPQPSVDQWAAPVAPTPPEPPSAPRRRSKWPILAVVGVLVIGVAAAGMIQAQSGGDDGGGGNGTPSGEDPGIPVPGEPTSLRARAKAFEVRLSWKEGVGSAETVKYLVYRDDDRLAEVTKTEFLDKLVTPDARYAYEVEAVAADGTASEVRAKISVKTLTAPPSTARLSGDYVVVFEETNHYGFSRFARDRFKVTWFLKPNCSKGPCTTVLSGDDRTNTKITLRFVGGGYAGSAQAAFLFRCGSAKSGGTVTVRLRPTDARSTDDGWKVVRFEGTTSERSPAQNGCVSAGADWKISGRLV